MEKKTLYNSLRMHFSAEANEDVEPWKVADYRAYSMDEHFSALSKLGVSLEQQSFAAFAEACASPEELSEHLAEELELEAEEEDHLFLHLFELWRRLVPEKQTFSLFADELDTQIFAYDQESLERSDALETAIANLLDLLTDQMDEGADPQELFQIVALHSANDLESFLYDFITDQIDAENSAYADELIEGFQPFVKDPKWLALLKVRVLLTQDAEEAAHLIERLLDLPPDEDIEFHLEFLALLVQDSDNASFVREFEVASKLLENEEDFQDLLQLAEEYLHLLDKEEAREKVEELLQRRTAEHTARFSQEDPDLQALKAILR